MSNIYTDLQRAQFRLYMGMSKLFANSNAIFENVLNEIQSTLDDGSTFNLTLSILANLQTIDQQIVNNSLLGLATKVDGKVSYDAYRNDALLRDVGRRLINQLATIFSMDAQCDYYGIAKVSSYSGIRLHGAEENFAK